MPINQPVYQPINQPARAHLAHLLTQLCGAQCFLAAPLTPSVGTFATAASRSAFV
jgi:hypothetical protein